jgi:hypothetical protein
MKVIGKAAGDQYVAIVNHAELEKAAGKYYGNMKRLEVGDEHDIGAGHNFTSDIQRACHEMRDAVKAFDNAQATMMRFAVMVSQLPDAAKEEVKS